MAARLVFGASAAALVIGCASSDRAVSPDEDAIATRADSLVNGQPDTTHAAVMLQSCRTSCLCTGTMVQKDERTGVGFIVTAAHCLPDIGPDAGQAPEPRFFVEGDKAATFGSGLASVVTPGAIRYPVLDWVRHPDFVAGTKGHASDIAIVRVLGVGPSTPTMTLGGVFDGLINKLPVVDVGYGSSGALGDSMSLGLAGTRQYANVLVSAVEPKLVVVAGNDPGGGINLGDDGGPMLASVGGVEVIVGVHSARVSVSGGTRQESTRISAMRQWLDAELAKTPPIDDCNSCLRTATSGTRACAALTRGCLDNATCNAYALCLETCADEAGPTQACRDRCSVALPNGAPIYTPGLACACETCASVCGATCDGMSGVAGADAGIEDGGTDASGPRTSIVDRPADTGCSATPASFRTRDASAMALVALSIALLRRRRRR